MADSNENVSGQNKERGGRSGRYIFNASFAAYFIIILALALLRVIIYFGAFDWAGDDGIDLIFSFIAQIIILAGGSIIVIACLFKKGFKGTLDYLQVKKPKPYIFLAFAIGFFGYFANTIINVISSFIFSFFGWHASGGGASATYPIWMFFVSVLFTAVLPGICEEVAHRGLVLRAMKEGGASDTKTILVTGLFFGLFHMYIGQTVFTFVMGCVMAFLTVKSKSIIPAIIMHFTNNLIAVCLDFFGLLNPMSDALNAGDMTPFVLFFLFCVVSVVMFILLLVLFLNRARKAGDCPPKKIAVYQSPYAPYGQGFAYAPFAYQPQQQYIKPQAQPISGNQPLRPESQGGEPFGAAYPQNPYTAQPFNPYAPPANPYAYQAPSGFYTAPVNNQYTAAHPPASEPAENAAPKPAGFKPSFKDKIFYYATMLLAGIITVISFISGL